MGAQLVLNNQQLQGPGLLVADCGMPVMTRVRRLRPQDVLTHCSVPYLVSRRCHEMDEV